MRRPSSVLAGPGRSRLATWVVLAGTLLGAVPGTFADEASSHLNLDWQAPAFELSSASGETFRYPGDLKHPTVVLFWATWCPFCKALMPHLQSILDERGESVTVLALNFREDQDPAAFLADNGLDFELLPGAEAVAEAWGVQGTPGLFLARPDGHVVFSIRAIPREEWPAVEVRDGKGQRSRVAARMSPFWAARLRLALDELVRQAP